MFIRAIEGQWIFLLLILNNAAGVSSVASLECLLF